MKINNNGFTLIELFIVVAIIGILASIAISVSLSMTERAKVAMIQSNLSTAFKTAVGYHTDNPESIVTIEILEENGFSKNDEIDIEILDGSVDSLRISAEHQRIDATYVIDNNGTISTL
jgi:prepilin-type N-terminal cleavage/methylation domain-containing protein